MLGGEFNYVLMGVGMLFGCYDFHSTFTSRAILPPYKGSTLRGTFGVALKKVLCALKFQECAACPINRTCLYAQVFENIADTETSDGKGVPHPFVIEPPLDHRTDYGQGAGLDFRLLLFGPHNDDFSYFVYAFQQTGSLGLGKVVDGRRAGFELKSVRSGQNLLFDSSEETIIPGAPEELTLESFQGFPERNSELRVVLETPLRLKFQNRFHDALPFHVLIRAALRRISSLNRHFADGEPDIDYKGIVQRSNGIRVIDQDVNWLDWARYSNRQETKMHMGGLVGELTYGGKLEEFVPLLRYCEKVHLGKATTFGLGKIRLELIS